MFTIFVFNTTQYRNDIVFFSSFILPNIQDDISYILINELDIIEYKQYNLE